MTFTTLTAEDVRDIRASTRPIQLLAHRYGVSYSHIDRIRRGVVSGISRQPRTPEYRNGYSAGYIAGRARGLRDAHVSAPDAPASGPTAPLPLASAVPTGLVR